MTFLLLWIWPLHCHEGYICVECDRFQQGALYINLIVYIYIICYRIHKPAMPTSFALNLLISPCRTCRWVVCNLVETGSCTSQLTIVPTVMISLVRFKTVERGPTASTTRTFIVRGRGEGTIPPNLLSQWNGCVCPP